MSSIKVLKVTEEEVAKILAMQEGHFCDLKATRIAPAKLSRSIAAFANSEGGELFIGIDEDKTRGTRTWNGFTQPEDANGHIQAFEEMFPLSADFLYDFLSAEGRPGLVLRIEAAKTREIKFASNGKVYIRRSAANLPVPDGERLEILRRDKGLSSFETETVPCDPAIVTNSVQVISFMLEVIPTSEPEAWLRKQMILTADKPTVAGVILFADEPQAALPKRCGIKVYRYKTSDREGSRDSLAGTPISIEGSVYRQITAAVTTTQRIIESVQIRTPEGLESVHYPEPAVHEVITNAVLHRDYSIADDIHIKIFDNRVEILSPGTLPGHVTETNILKERFARNPVTIRLINKFPNPPNMDVGEGLNTAFQAMHRMKLKPPTISQSGGYVTVRLLHETLASPDEAILKYLETHDEIANRQARDVCYIYSENRMKTILQKMVKSGIIELVSGRSRYNAAYRTPQGQRGRDGKMPERRFAEFTDQPRIFRECYWGNFRRPAPDPKIIEGRNAFVSEFGVTKYAGSESPPEALGIFDHCELYKCKVGYVYIISPYDADKTVDRIASEMGFDKYRNLYMPNATTYVQTFSDKHKFNRAKKTWRREEEGDPRYSFDF